jgi:cytochrome c-type biogenesis protein CcmH/NrfG
MMLPAFKSVLLSFLVASLSTLFAVSQALASPADLLAAGRVDEVIASSQSQLKSSPNDAASYNLLCRAYFALEDWDRAIANCEKAVSLAPDNSDFHYWLGRAYGEKADRVNPFSGASLAKKLKNQFETAVKLDPNNVDARSDLAEFYIDAPGIIGGGVDKARGQANALMSISPAKGHYINGRIAEKNHDQTAAEKEYRAAIDASHGQAVDWFNLALYHRHNGDLDQMERALSEAVKAPGNNEILVESAEILVRTGRNLPKASEIVRRYINSETPVEKAPLFEAHYILGTVLEKQGDKTAAAREYQAALTLASNFSPAKLALQRVSK